MTHPVLGLASGGWLACWLAGGLAWSWTCIRRNTRGAARNRTRAPDCIFFSFVAQPGGIKNLLQFSKAHNSLPLPLQYFHFPTFLSLPERPTTRDYEIRRMSGKTSEKLSLRVFTSATKQKPGARNHKQAPHSQGTFCKQEVGSPKDSIQDKLASTSH